MRNPPAIFHIGAAINQKQPRKVRSFLYKDAKLLENRVIPAFRCFAVKENILRKFLEFNAVRVSEIGCRQRCVVRSWGEDIAESDEGLARKEG